MNPQIRQPLRSLAAHKLGFTVISGCLAIMAWTLLRFFDQGFSFDLYGQQVLAHQWLHGMHQGSYVGPTNYIWKMVFLYIPLDAISGASKVRLIILTMLINIAMYIALVVVTQKLWEYFVPGQLKHNQGIYLGLIWLASAAGSIFWIQFSNSRNLEVAGGLWFAYLSFTLVDTWSWPKAVALTLFGGGLFFADTLQLYMMVLPLLVYMVMAAVLYRRYSWPSITKLVGVIIAGLAIFKLLVVATRHVWHVQVGGQPGQSTANKFSPHMLVHGTVMTVKALAQLYSGGAGATGGKYREAINLLMIVVVVVAAAIVALRNAVWRPIFSLLCIVWLCDILVYVASGQALQPDTSRYLIMTAVVSILFFGLATQLSSRLTKILIVLLACNLLTLFLGLATNWRPDFPHDAHVHAVEAFQRSNHPLYVYSDADSAIATDYLSDYDVHALPLVCLPNGTLATDYLFFDRANFTALMPIANSAVPLIFNGQTVTNFPASCSQAQIITQIGAGPIRRSHLADGSQVLWYSAQQLQRAFPAKPGVMNGSGQ